MESVLGLLGLGTDDLSGGLCHGLRELDLHTVGLGAYVRELSGGRHNDIADG